MGLNEFVMRAPCMCNATEKVTLVSSLEDEPQLRMWTESKYKWKMLWKIFVTVLSAHAHAHSHSRFECTFEQFNPTISFEASTPLHQQTQLLCVSAILMLYCLLNEIRVAFLSPFLFSSPNLCENIYLLCHCCCCCHCCYCFTLCSPFSPFIDIHSIYFIYFVVFTQ